MERQRENGLAIYVTDVRLSTQKMKVLDISGAVQDEERYRDPILTPLMSGS